MNLVIRTPPPSTYDAVAGRPVTAVVLHNTVGFDGIQPQRGASWHYLIERSGTVYADVPEPHCAHHVASTDRWRPPWVIPSPLAGLSDVNYCALGIEIVSTNGSPTLAWDGYTTAQYQAFRELAADIVSRHGALPFVAHGDVQLNRSDPVLWNYDLAGLSSLGAVGRTFLGGNMATVAELEAQVRSLNGVNTTLQQQLEYVREQWALANSHIGALEAHTIPDLQAKVVSLETQLANTTQPIAARLARAIEYDDGHRQEITAT